MMFGSCGLTLRLGIWGWDVFPECQMMSLGVCLVQGMVSFEGRWSPYCESRQLLPRRLGRPGP